MKLRLPRWLIGGFKPIQPIKFPVDASLSARQRAAKERLRAQNVDIRPIYPGRLRVVK